MSSQPIDPIMIHHRIRIEQQDIRCLLSFIPLLVDLTKPRLTRLVSAGSIVGLLGIEAIPKVFRRGWHIVDDNQPIWGLFLAIMTEWMQAIVSSNPYKRE